LAFLAYTRIIYCSDGFVYLVPIMLERVAGADIDRLVALHWAQWKQGHDTGHPPLGDALKSLRIEDNGAGKVIAQYARKLMVSQLADNSTFTGMDSSRVGPRAHSSTADRDTLHFKHEDR
jgi:hypothetical protein